MNKRTKILLVNKLYRPWIGGVEKVVQDIAEGLNGRGDIEVSVIVAASRGRGAADEINGVTVYRASSLGIFWGMPVSFGFLGLFRKLAPRYDLIFLHHPFPTGMIAYLLFGRRKSLVVWYHSDIVRQKIMRFLFGPVLNAALKRARHILVSNPNLIKSSAVLARFKEKCVVIPFGINPSRFEPTTEVLRKADDMRARFGAPIVLSVGRLAYYKGFEYLVRAAKEVDARFLIVGNGPLRAKLDSLIFKAGLQNNVFMFSSVSDDELAAYYHACDVFVLPSIAPSEAFGIVILEAMACGKPVISTELGTGTSWVNKDGETGLVVQPRDVMALSDAIKKIISDKKLAGSLGESARKRVLSEFTLEKMLEGVREASASKR